ncbi:hypothetical protein KDL01_28300 [Actinospica durhamensis]|uniref:Uncharacterized protein n=1 Tax=Actinospica durhamensis TaxID=1508375 RepID=A0A941ESF3_9ACTN|nr:hypothetical protein [Actinospica durhamensis]MBR7837212.1 hypothetical protein [Actinospica durhamensis]
MSSTDHKMARDTGIDDGLEENEEYWPREQDAAAAPQTTTTTTAAQSDEADEESDEADELDETGEFDELDESEEPELEPESESESEESEKSEPESGFRSEYRDEDAAAGAYDLTPQPDEAGPQTAFVTPQPEELNPQRDEFAAQPEGVAKPEDLGGRNLGRGAEPLLSADEQQEFLTEWTRIQVSFVEDPPTAVQHADALVQGITASLLTALNTRSGELAAEGGAASDTEQLRLALRQYRAFIGVLLPEHEQETDAVSPAVSS